MVLSCHLHLHFLVFMLDRQWHLSFLALVEQEGDGADDDGEGN
jgi:hypothetical protein